ncbi:MAG: hypothetical protein GWN77_02000, partial [Gammaproteobacteria bacterium]|nr:hypothetical protein [Gammaproteobacteria bacterium]
MNYVAPTSNQEVWVAGNNGTVLRTTDGGQTWSNVWNGAAGTTFYTIEAVDANTALVSTWTGGANVAQLYRTSDGGQSWAMVFEQTNGFINNITLFDQNQGMTIGDPVGGVWTVLQTRNGGQTWTPITNAPAAVAGDYAGPYSINWVDQSTCWFGSIKSNIFQTTNGGTSWNAGVISLLTSVNSLAFNANGTGLAAYFEGQVARTRDGGSSWETISLPGSGILRYLLSSQNA